MGFIENHPSNIPVVRDPCRPSRKQRRDSSQGWGIMVRSRSGHWSVDIPVGEAGKVFSL